MGKITFILGGARSGKSRYALKLAKDIGGKAAFIATCELKDSEMKKRACQHRKARPPHWKTFEEPLNPGLLLKKIGAKFDLVLIDCLTLLVSNLILKGLNESRIINRINEILRRLKKIRAQAIIVSNEVGSGIVPENKLARDFRDIAGRISQITAEKADSVFFMVSGIALKLKDKEVIKGE